MGKIVETAPVRGLFSHPLHPYTEALLSAIPRPDPRIARDQIILRGEIADPAHPPSGCYLHPRCLYAQSICSEVDPPWEEVEAVHFVACHFARELSLVGVKM